MELFANPLAHLPLETPIIFLMGGIMTDCGIPAEEIGQILGNYEIKFAFRIEFERQFDAHM